MTVADLIAALQDMPQDAEVRIATQPEWPLAFEVEGVADPDTIAGETACEDHGSYSCEECMEEPESSAVWITAGSHPADTPYAPRAAWTAANRY